MAYLIMVGSVGFVPHNCIVHKEYSDIVLVDGNDVAKLQPEPCESVVRYSHLGPHLLDNVAVGGVLQHVAERHGVSHVCSVPVPVFACHYGGRKEEIICGQTLNGGFPEFESLHLYAQEPLFQLAHRGFAHFDSRERYWRHERAFKTGALV